MTVARSARGSRVTVAATVGGVPVLVDDVDAREDQLRRSRLAASLPRPGTSEGRQLRRWLTQLLVTERVAAAEAAKRGLTAVAAPSEHELLPDTTTRLEIGSIVGAVLADPLARALFVSVTAEVDVTEIEVREYGERNPRRFGSTVEIADHLRGAARRRAFRVWLDARCAELVELASGYEHPGDPRQPDNTHRH
jgi:[acyl-carrier-protein] S-malonyltransferase